MFDDKNIYFDNMIFFCIIIIIKVYGDNFIIKKEVLIFVFVLYIFDIIVKMSNCFWDVF